MAINEEITSTVKTASDGTVKLALEAYQDLVERAAVKPAVINRTTVVRSASVAASDHKMWGLSLTGIGVGLVVVGVIAYLVGRAEAADSVEES